MRKEEINNKEVLPEMEEVEGYAICDSASQQCRNDCIWPLAAHAFSYND